MKFSFSEASKLPPVDATISTSKQKFGNLWVDFFGCFGSQMLFLRNHVYIGVTSLNQTNEISGCETNHLSSYGSGWFPAINTIGNLKWNVSAMDLGMKSTFTGFKWPLVNEFELKRSFHFRLRFCVCHTNVPRQHDHLYVYYHHFYALYNRSYLRPDPR